MAETKGSDEKGGAVVMEGREVADQAAPEVAAARSDCAVLEISKPSQLVESGTTNILPSDCDSGDQVPYINTFRYIFFFNELFLLS